MNPIRMLGAVVFAVGVVLLAFAYNASNAPLDQISNTLTGRFTDRTMLYLVLGVVAAVGGALAALYGRRS
jgi:drug/metabolite transporter (DMT)-like permease